MKTNQYIKGMGATLCYTLLSSAILTASAQAEVAQTPLNLSEGVPPNMIFTLDESGSMSWAFVPDAGSNVYNNKIGGYNTRRMRAANANPMYYNPNVIYRIPPTFAQNGTEITLSTSFTDAPINGLWIPSEWNNSAGRGKLDLSTNYRLPWTHRQGTTNDNGTFTYAAHPADFSTQTFTIPSTNGTHIIGPNEEQQFRYEITRSTKGKTTTCSAKVYMGAGNAVVKTPSCSISGNTVTVSNNYTSTGVPAYYYEFEPSYKRTANDAVGSCGIFSDASGTGKDAFAQSERCYRLVWVDETSAYDTRATDPNRKRLKHPDGSLVDGRENFAIWFSFYRSRALATLSAAKIAFYDLSPDIRFTWQDLATCTSFTSETAACGKNRLKPYSNVHRGEFYTWLRKRYFNTGTPLPAAMKRAGEFLKTADPWKKNPYATGANSGNTTENTYACRPSYHVLMTDGMWNADSAAPAGARLDHTAFSTPGGDIYTSKSYTNQKPFYDSSGTSSKPTLADLAMHYWATDLNTSLDNKVTPYIPFKNTDSNKEYWDPRNNPAEWQSMSNFIMALGLTTSLGSGTNSDLPWEGGTHAGDGYDRLKAGTKNWPVASNGSANNVYDLWHAAINSRGEFYSVDTPEGMVQAFKDILSRIADRKSSASKPGISVNLELTTDADGDVSGDRFASYFYQSSYDSTVWSGDIALVKKYVEYNHNYNANASPGTPNSIQFTERVETIATASDNLPKPYSARNIKIAVDGVLKPFNSDNAGSLSPIGTPEAQWTLADHLARRAEDGVRDSDENWKNRLNFLRGDRSHEGDGVDQFRVRGNTVLGDFFASQPTIVAGAKHLPSVMDKLEGGTSYTDFYRSNKSRQKLMYIGGNSGMLHAFDAQTMVEKFAFIPTSVFPNLNKLTGKNYTHHFYVDGSPVVSDVYDGSVWRTVLVGTLRAGGKGIFALDVTDPNDIKLLWELTDKNFPSQINGERTNVKLGYTFSKPSITRLHNGRWAVVTGNGYKADGANNGAASLLVIDAVTGELIKSLEVQSPRTDVSNLENGLSTPTIADYDGDGIADYAYAGDLQGNLWRFDLLGQSASSSANGGSYGGKNDGDSNFKVSNQGKPLFTARSSNGYSQPITAAPTLIRHPSRQGFIVAFGTGKYFESGDKSGDTSFVQSAYGVWDRYTKAESNTYNPITRTQLQNQSISSQGVSTMESSGVDYASRTLSKNEVAWAGTDNGTKLGWYFDLSMSGTPDGEMVIEKIERIGDLLLMQSLVPNDDPCTSGSSNWLYAISATNGGATDHHVFDAKGSDGKVLSALKIGSEGGVSFEPGHTKAPWPCVGAECESPSGFGSGGLGGGEPDATKHETKICGYVDGSPIHCAIRRQTWRRVQD